MKSKGLISTITLALTFLLLACGGGGDDGGGTTEPNIAVTNVSVVDLGNNANAADIRVSFNIPASENAVSTYRAYVVKAANVGNFSLSVADGLSTNSYVSIPKTGQDITAFLTAGLLDVEGNAITEGDPYIIYILSVADGTNATANQLASQSNQMTLSNSDYLEIVAEMPIGTGGVEVDGDGNIYCSDFGSALSGGTAGRFVYKVTPNGETSIFASGLNGASGNTFGSDGNFYQSNIAGGSVSTITLTGQVSNFVSGMSSPVGIVFDKEENLFVANCGDNTVKKVDTNNQVTTFASGTIFNCPNGITIDDDGNLYVANFSNSNVVKIDPQGNSSVLASFSGNNNGHITFFEGNLYVVARAANQIYRVDLQGNSELIAGSGTRGHVEGSALEANLSLPNDLMFSPDGKYLYINDTKPLSGTPASSSLQPTYLKRIGFKRD